jgi:RecA/RadA recombinase
MAENSRDRELSLIAHFIKRPDVLRGWKDRLEEWHWDYGPAKVLYSLLQDALDRHDEVPTLVEFLWTVEKYNEVDGAESLTASRRLLDAEAAYTIEVTGSTSDRIAEFVLKREYKQMSEQMSELEPDQILSTIPDFRTKLDKLQALGGRHTDIGISVFGHEMLSNCMSVIQSLEGDPIPTGMPRLDARLQGGWRRGELVMVVAATGTGKSQTMFNWALGAVAANFRAIYYAFDNLELEMVQRIWAAQSQRPINEERDWDEYQQYLRAKARGPHDRFILKGFPPNRISPQDLQRHIKQVRDYYYVKDKADGVAEESCGRVDLVVVDYLDYLIPMRFSKERHDTLKMVTEDLLTIAREEEVAMISASQINREGMKTDNPRMDQIAGAIGKADPASHLFVFAQSKAEKINGKARLINNKSRRVDSLYVIPLLIDVARQTIMEDMTIQPWALNDAPGAKSQGPKPKTAEESVGESTREMTPEEKVALRTQLTGTLAKSSANPENRPMTLGRKPGVSG